MAAKKKARKVAKKKKAASKKSPKKGAPIATVLEELEAQFPKPKCALNFKSPLELLIATILSAQCTDERVNKVTADLFVKYESLSDYADAPEGELEVDIRSTGFFNNKAKSIRRACAALRDEFKGKVPKTMEELLRLPGVARKTANVVLGTAFGITSGIVVDTHVSRISQRLGLTKETRPDKIEASLMKIVPEEEWIDFSHRIILFGRSTCQAKKPACKDCPLGSVCPSRDELYVA